jgi:hypothetical protein
MEQIEQYLKFPLYRRIREISTKLKIAKIED